MSKDENLSRRARQAQKDLQRHVQTALENPSTRVFVRWVLHQAGIYETGGSPEDAGRRDLGLDIISLLNRIDPYEYVRLMKEAADDLVVLQTKAKQTDQEEDPQDVY